MAGTRTRLLTNELAMIVPSDAPAERSVARVLEGGVARLAMGEPAAVPAGVYGRAWLERQGAWARLEAKVVPFPTVTAVLSAVANGRVDAGIVYRTDAMASKSVRMSSRACRRKRIRISTSRIPPQSSPAAAKPRQENFSSS